MKEWTVVRNCNWLHEAQIVKSVLEADGLEVLIPDEHILGVQPLYANALGGVRVMVRFENLDHARRILDAMDAAAGSEGRGDDVGG
jgi:hypothetical protein